MSDARELETFGSKRLRLRRPDACVTCSRDLPAGTDAIWESRLRVVICLECSGTLLRDAAKPAFAPVSLTQPDATAPGTTIAGGSARREYDRRIAKDEARLRDTWGPFGGFAVALSSERTSTKVWARGAIGEEKVGAMLDKLRSENVAVFHDLRVPRKSSNIDHVVVTPGGVWVVDTKRYVGKRPTVLVEGGVFRPRTETLTVGGRRQGALVDGLLRQIDVVGSHIGDVHVRGVLCFVDSEWPLFGGAFSTNGVAVVWPKKLAELIRSDLSGPTEVSAVARTIASQFRPA